MFLTILGLVGFTSTYMRKSVKLDLRLPEALEQRMKTGIQQGDKMIITQVKEQEGLMSYKLTELQNREVTASTTRYDVPTVTLSGISEEMTESETRRREWENGQIDYLGEDRFDNIKKKLNESMGCNPSYNVNMPL